MGSVGDLRLRSHLSSGLRIEAFPAVYRAPGPLLAPPGYEFPRSSRMDLCIAASIHSSPVSSFTHDQTIAISFWDITLRVQVALLSRKEQEFLGFTAAFLRGSGFFSPTGIASGSFLCFPSSTRRRSGFRFGHHLAVQPFAPSSPCPFEARP
jgi:hypothetical protein